MVDKLEKWIQIDAILIEKLKELEVLDIEREELIKRATNEGITPEIKNLLEDSLRKYDNLCKEVEQLKLKSKELKANSKNITEITYENFLNDLRTYYNEKRSLFNQNILKTSKEVLGLTTNEIKTLAKKYKDISFDDFDVDRVYEVTLLYFLISINRLKTIEEKIKFYKDNVILIDTWAITDTVAPYLKKASFEDALNLMSDDEEYIIRLGCVLMLNYAKDTTLTHKILNSLKYDTRDYVKMAEGWLLSYLFMFNFDVAYDWAKTNDDLDEIILIGIQKGIDSFRVSDENKNKLRELRKQIRSVF